MTLPTEQFAVFLSHIDARSLPMPVCARVSQHVLDVIAGLFAGTGIAEAKQVLPLLGDSVPDVAGKVAMLAHAAEADPIHAETALCAGMIAVPPALLYSPDGATAVAAVIAGYETAIRIGAALGSARLLGQGWWPTAVLGGVGAAAATARAKGLDVTQTRNALSLALIQAGGLGTGAPDAPQSRNLLAAQCVRIGVMSTEAAAAGLSGPAEPLVGERGFLTAFGLETFPERLLDGLRESWKINETSLKAFPCALQAQSALDALGQVRETKRLQGNEIEAIVFELPGAMRRIVNRPGAPTSHFGAAASLQFLAALSWLDGDIHPARMAGARQGVDNLLALMKKIQVKHAPGLDKEYPARWPARVRVKIGADEYVKEVHIPSGHPERSLSLSDTVDRFRRYSAEQLDADTQDRLIDAVTALAGQSDLDVVKQPILKVL